MQPQLPLGLIIPERVNLESFCVGGNAAVLDAVTRLSNGQLSQLYLWGNSGTGKTHLLQAVCQQIAEQGKTVAYLPLQELLGYSVDVFSGLELMKLICIDDMDSVASHPDWQEALFNLYNRVSEHGNHILFAARNLPAETGIGLPDLVSRLGWGETYAIQELSDADKLGVLQTRASGQGLELPDETASYLIRRYPRDMVSLMELIEKLDRASLAASRRLTVPFVKQALMLEE
ncbi:MAG TPA: DnaA regulatory inactivator Hda [Gammaproteobacteria bacterium]|nr:DnaA regulatory inactivator Hda [Gammaproteobacteria bacterium]